MTSQLFRVECPKCINALQVEKHHLTGLTRCPHCKTVFKVEPDVPSQTDTNAANTKRDVLTFQTMMVDPEQFAEKEYWAKPVGGSMGGSQSRVPVISNSASRGSQSRKQFINKHPGKEVSKVVVQVQAPREIHSHRRRPSIQQMNSEKSTVDETVTAAGVIMLLIGVVLSMLPILDLETDFVRQLNKSFPALGFLMTISGFGMVIYANRRQGLPTLIAIGGIGLLVAIGIGGWTELVGQRNEVTLDVNPQQPDNRGNRDDDNLRVAGGGQGGARITSDAQESSGDPGNGNAGKVEVDDHWNPLLVNPGDLKDRNLEQPGRASRPALPDGGFGLPTVRPNDKVNGNQADNRASINSIRTTAVIMARFRNGRLIPDATRKSFETGRGFAGTLTARGQMMGDGKAIVGFDFTEQFRSTLLTPVYGGEEALSQTSMIAGKQLAGLNLAIRGNKVVAVQGVFAPVFAGRLRLSDSEKGKWLGDRSKADSYQSIMSEGQTVSALAVYLREDYVLGVGFVY